MDAPAAPRFEQIGTSSVYETKVAGSVGWAGYLLSPEPGLPDAIAFEDSLADQNGHYLFCTERPAGIDEDPAGFATKALRYIAAATRNRAVVWLASADPVVFGDFSRYGLPFLYFGSVYQATADLNLPFGSNAAFHILNQTRLAIAGDALKFSASAINSPPFIAFQTNDGDPLGVRLAPTSNRIEAFVPFTGANSGCVTFDGALDPKAAFDNADLGLGFRYVLRDQDTQQLETIGYSALSATELPRTLSIAGCFDPSDPANQVISGALLEQGYLRSGMAFKEAGALPSAFRTAGGQPVLLTPLGAEPADVAPALAAGGFAWATEAASNEAASSAPAYLALAGRYAMGVAGSAPGRTERLMGGMFGSETLSFRVYDPGHPAEQNDLLQAIPARPAFAPIFPFAAADLNQPASGAIAPRLTSEHQTSWVTLVSGSGSVTYSAEPEGSPLYAALAQDPAPANADVAVLGSSPPGMALPQGTDKSFPLVPYGAASSAGVDSDTLVQFESQILAASRKTLISGYGAEIWAARANASRAADGGTGEVIPGTTPQGFVVRRDAASDAYLDVTMAQSINRDGTNEAFALASPTRAMQDSLQTNQLFLVAVNPAPFENPATGAVFHNRVTIANWEMAARIGAGASATAYRNVLIMKFCSGSLRDRVANPNRWTAAEEFSLLAGTPDETRALSYTGLSQWLQDYIDTGIALSKGPSAPFYEDFARIVTDPDWTGVIVLAADLAAEDLPPEVAGLAAGIDFTRFNAHHFGFTVSRVAVDKQSGAIALAEGNSSLFGLIDYQDPLYASNRANGVAPDVPIAVATTGDFGFTVLQLQSLFEHAQLTRFESHVQLSVAALFGAPVTRLYNGGRAQPFPGIVLNGSYVEQDGRASYVFEQNDTNVLISPSNVLPAVAFERVQFNTLGVRDGGATVASSFLVWGAFDFTALDTRAGELLDLLSFGSPANTPEIQLGQGLAFSGLTIGMSYPSATPGAKRFVVDTGKLAWDLNASTIRDESLFRGFALQLKSFVNASGDQKPSDLGFLPVTSQLDLTELAAPWFGVVYDITLGGPGALASGMGFQSQLLLAWSPSTTGSNGQHAVFVGMSLPGAAPGASMFSIQGVFKVAVGAISILRQPVPTAPGRPPSTEEEFFYCLRIDDIGLKIFGIVKLPPSANIQFFLFGDPNSSGSLGWYAAYVADDNPGCGQSLAFAELAAGPRERAR
ncbi:hypothetical protein [Sphingosinithalassobacter sp. LHW66-3]|uniref:hypothetical protein n=1 Tax=Sphingosinithalassobacter sp. LHW66-3 TaxID=3424718 RepID=UPI003D6A9C9C